MAASPKTSSTTHSTSSGSPEETRPRAQTPLFPPAVSLGRSWQDPVPQLPGRTHKGDRPCAKSESCATQPQQTCPNELERRTGGRSVVRRPRRFVGSDDLRREPFPIPTPA